MECQKAAEDEILYEKEGRREPEYEQRRAQIWE